MLSIFTIYLNDECQSGAKMWVMYVFIEILFSFYHLKGCHFIMYTYIWCWQAIKLYIIAIFTLHSANCTVRTIYGWNWIYGWKWTHVKQTKTNKNVFSTTEPTDLILCFCMRFDKFMIIFVKCSLTISSLLH